MDAYGHSERFSVPMEGENGCPRALREVFSAGGGRKWMPTGTQRGFQYRCRVKMDAYGHSNDQGDGSGGYCSLDDFTTESYESSPCGFRCSLVKKVN